MPLFDRENIRQSGTTRDRQWHSVCVVERDVQSRTYLEKMNPAHDAQRCRVILIPAAAFYACNIVSQAGAFPGTHEHSPNRMGRRFQIVNLSITLHFRGVNYRIQFEQENRESSRMTHDNQPM